MNKPHVPTVLAGCALAVLGGYSLVNSLTKREGTIHLTLALLGMAMLPLSFFVVDKSKQVPPDL